jgi:uridylate kinase
MKATKVDGVYASDPKKDPLAVRYDRISFSEVLQKDLKVMDATAISLARDQNMRIVVFNLRKKGNIKKIVLGKSIGTLVEGFDHAE